MKTFLTTLTLVTVVAGSGAAQSAPTVTVDDYAAPSAGSAL